MSGPANTRVQRHLAAILAADAVGFSRLMAQDEEGTLRRIKSLRRKIIEPKVRAHQGRVFKTTGDGFLVEFSSPVEAVRCALEAQETLASQATQECSQALQLRIGINLGDVISEEDGDVYGDGVNVAVRLEQLAEPGSVYISGSVYDQIEGKIGIAFESQGEQQVKNIARPVRVFRRLTIAPAASIGLGVSGRPLALPDRPSIAVMPFSNMSTDPEQEFFADGITEDIITGLAKLRWLFVIARNSTFTYKGKAVDVRQVARDLGVRYILEGSVRASGRRIRITGQLIDASTGKHIWAEKYDRELDDIFAVQDEITENVVATVEPHLYVEEGFRANSKPPDTLDTWGLVVRALALVNKGGRKQNAEAQTLLQQAIEIEPGYARAHAILSWARWWAAFSYWDDRDQGFERALQGAERALAIDPDEPWARIVSGLIRSAAGGHDRAIEELAAAIRLSPSFALAHTMYGLVLLRAGRFDAAIEMTAKALRMSPADSFAGFYNAFHGLALLGARRFAEALPHLRASIAAFSGYPGLYNTLISCCGHLGLLDEAKSYIAYRNQIGPPLTRSVLRNNLKFFAHCEVFVEGLEKAGVPE